MATNGDGMTSEEAPRLTIIMPVYNEGSTLKSALDALWETDLGTTYEILLVDDGSDDGAVDQISHPNARVIRHERNRGKGAAIRTGIDAARGSLITVLDADLEYNPADYRNMLDAIDAKQATVVYGTRSFGSHSAFSFWYVLGNRFLGFWASFLYNTWLSDIETCFKMAPADVWRSLRLKSDGFGIEAEATAKFLKKGHRIYEVPITYTARTRAEGKKLKWTDGLVALALLTWIRIKG
jgi:dolichol-phosphate hexosyltransferase